MKIDFSNLDRSLPSLRRQYHKNFLHEKSLERDPLRQFQKWFLEALRDKVLKPNAMVLATAPDHGMPSARTVLLKACTRKGFFFNSNYESRKGKELARNPQASLVFHWPEQERQVVIRGRVSKVSRKESEAYFRSRPFMSQIAAVVSRQSRVVKSRLELEKKFNELAICYRGKKVPLPRDWGGYCLSPRLIEFWQGRPNRLNDRLQYRKRGNGWKIERLAP